MHRHPIHGNNLLHISIKDYYKLLFDFKNEGKDREFSNNVLLLVLGFISLIEFFFIQIFIFKFGVHDFSITCLLPKMLRMI